jgi:hypothetical protein
VEAVTVGANAVALNLKHQLSKLEKQIRMLDEMAEAGPAMHRGGYELEEQGQEDDFVVMHRQRTPKSLGR